MSTRIVDREKVALGLADLFLASSDTHIASTTPVLTSTDYFGAKAEVSFIPSKEYIRRSGVVGNVIVALDHLLTRAGFAIEISFIEIKSKSLSYALGGDGTNPDFFTNLLTNPVFLRAELIFTYPNKINKLQIILPRVQVTTQEVPFKFQTEDMLQSPMEITSVKTDNAAWIDNPIGKSIFV